MISYLKDEDKHKIGFYMVTNIFTNETYFGSGILGDCFYRHSAGYKNNNHRNKNLREAFIRTPNGWEFIATPVEEYNSPDENRLEARAFEQGDISEYWGNPLLMNISKNAYTCRLDYTQDQKDAVSARLKDQYATGTRVHWQLGKEVSSEVKEKLRIAGVKFQQSLTIEQKEENRLVLIAASKKRFDNETEESKLKRSNTAKNIPLSDNFINACKQLCKEKSQKISIRGITYQSIKEAARLTGENYATIYRYLHRDNQPDYIFIE
jgi:hypothetical protein